MLLLNNSALCHLTLQFRLQLEDAMISVHNEATDFHWQRLPAAVSMRTKHSVGVDLRRLGQVVANCKKQASRVATRKCAPVFTCRLCVQHVGLLPFLMKEKPVGTGITLYFSDFYVNLRSDIWFCNSSPYIIRVIKTRRMRWMKGETRNEN